MEDAIYTEPAKSERKFRQLKALGQELKIPIMETFLEIEVKDGKGNITTHFKQRSHSWNRNAYNILLCQLGGTICPDSTYAAGKVSLKDTGGTVKYSSAANCGMYITGTMGTGFGYLGASGSNAIGIQFGNNTEADDFEAYALTGLIANGTSSGNLSYVASQPIVQSYDTPSTTWTVTIVRFANNNTGGTTSVNEIGLVAYDAESSTTGNVMHSRDHLSSTINVLDTGQIKATYTLTLQFPA